MDKFGRQTIFEIGKPGQRGRQWSDLHMRFRVHHKPGGRLNTGSFEIYNLPKDVVSLAREKDTLVRFRAGYAIPTLLFQGNPVIKATKEEKEGVDRLLVIEALDGKRKFEETILDICFEDQVTAIEVFEHIEQQLGLPRGVIQISSEIVFSQGLTLTGPADRALDRLARMSDAQWSVTDNVLEVLEKGKTYNTNTVPEYSTESGTLLSVAYKKKGVEAKVLLDGTMRPGRRFTTHQPPNYRAYKARDVVHEGDSGFDDEFTTTIIGRAL
jgi:hypothetical protein